MAIKAGDLVRVSKAVARRWSATRTTFGAVEEVRAVHADGAVDLVRSATTLPYVIPAEGVKLAKQAMRKRDEYSARRG